MLDVVPCSSLLRRGAVIALLLTSASGCGDGSGATTATGPTATGTMTVASTAGTARTPSAGLSPRLLATPGIRQTVLGKDAGLVTILQPTSQPPGPRPVVAFLHGWGALSPQFYGAWIAHLVHEGNTVIYPRYQVSFVSPPQEALGSVQRALREAFAVAPPAVGSLVLAGHSAGGALSADYAATAARAGLPEPVAIFAAYPGRSLQGIPLKLPEARLKDIPSSVHVVALGGAHDTTVGTSVARRIGRLGRFVLVRNPQVDVHRGPLQTGAAARTAFWAPLDRLIRAARG